MSWLQPTREECSYIAGSARAAAQQASRRGSTAEARVGLPAPAVRDEAMLDALEHAHGTAPAGHATGAIVSRIVHDGGYGGEARGPTSA